jgi:hypothetical protein
MVSLLQKYMMQRGMPMQGMAGAGGPGAGAQPATPIGPGVADPYSEGEFSPELTNADDGMNEFDPRRRTRPYLGDAAGGGAQMRPNRSY